MNIYKEQQGSRLEVTLSGKFTFSDNQAYRNILEQIANPQVTHITFHMRQVDFVDSAALGMLLLARDEAQKHDKKLIISGIQGQVKKMFSVARFDSLFSLQNDPSFQ